LDPRVRAGNPELLHGVPAQWLEGRSQVQLWSSLVTVNILALNENIARQAADALVPLPGGAASAGFSPPAPNQSC